MMKKCRYFIIIFFLFIIFIQAKVYAADKCIVNIYGVVKDETGNTIEGVDVYCGTDKKATTNENGEFSIWINKEQGKETISLKKDGYSMSSQKITTFNYKINDKYKDIKNVQNLYYGNTNSKNTYTVMDKKLKQSFKKLGLNYEGTLENSNNKNISNAISEHLNINHRDNKCYVFNYVTNSNVGSTINFLNLSAYRVVNLYDMFINVDINGNNLKPVIENNLKTRNILKKLFDPMKMDAIAATKILKYMYENEDRSVILSEIKDNKTSNGDIEIDINDENDYQIEATIKDDGTSSVGGNVTVKGNIVSTRTDKTLPEGLDVEMNIYNQNGTLCKRISNITEQNFEYTANLESGKTYYIEYVFLEDAWNKGFSSQEFDILYDSSNDSTTQSKVTRYATKNSNTNYVVPNNIDYDVEQELDKYENTKIIAKTSTFTVNSYVEDDETKYPEIEANVTLKDRKDLNVELTSKVTNVKIVLTNGNAFINQPVDNNFWSMPDLKYIYMTSDIMYGSTVYVEYEIKIVNHGTTTGNKFEILDYLDNIDGMQLAYNPKEKLLSDGNKTNETEGWQVDETDPNISYKSDLITNVKLKNTMNMGNNKEVTKRLVISQVITPEKDSVYQNDVGIISYKNNEKQRNGTFNNYRRAGTKELFSSSETIYVLVPFGGSKKNEILAYIKWLLLK